MTSLSAVVAEEITFTNHYEIDDALGRPAIYAWVAGHRDADGRLVNDDALYIRTPASAREAAQTLVDAADALELKILADAGRRVVTIIHDRIVMPALGDLFWIGEQSERDRASVRLFFQAVDSPRFEEVSKGSTWEDEDGEFHHVIIGKYELVSQFRDGGHLMNRFAEITDLDPS